MKKICMLLSLPVLIYASPVLAQKSTFKLSPLSLIIRDVHVQAETALDDVSSVQVGVTWFQRLKFNAYGGVMTISGFGIFPEYRYFFSNRSKDVPEGFYGGAYGAYRRYRGEFEFENDNRTGVGTGGINIYGIGGEIGYQVISGWFVFDINGGLGYYAGELSTIRVEYSDGTSGFVPLGRLPKLTGPLPRINMGFGVAF